MIRLGVAKPVVTYRAVIALDVSVLLRVTRLNIFQTNTLFLGNRSMNPTFKVTTCHRRGATYFSTCGT